MRLNKANVLDTVQTIHPKEGSIPPLPNVLKCKTRLLLGEESTRTLLAQFVLSKPSPMKASDFTSLLAVLKVECKALHDILLSLQQEEEFCASGRVFNYSFPGIWKQFLAVLVTPTSVVRIFQPAIIPTILHLTEGHAYDTAHHQVMMQHCPSLASLLVHFKDKKLSNNLCALLLAMVAKVQTPLPGQECASALPPPLHVGTQKASNPTNIAAKPPAEVLGSTVPELEKILTQVQNGLSALSIDFKFSNLEGNGYTIIPEIDTHLSACFWCWLKLRELPQFEGIDPPAVSNTQTHLFNADKNQWTDPEQEFVQADLVCNKQEHQGYSARSLTEGLFVGSCLHTVCLGWHSMIVPEG